MYFSTFGPATSKKSDLTELRRIDDRNYTFSMIALNCFDAVSIDVVTMVARPSYRTVET